MIIFLCIVAFDDIKLTADTTLSRTKLGSQQPRNVSRHFPSKSALKIEGNYDHDNQYHEEVLRQRTQQTHIPALANAT
jgi:hypothetical protein